ncbi:MAG: tetratricopeptide repeat protein [Candidatus Marinimicrobia bacterium]|nr:tetratricopeptide repeat protein [Candidatus Neomarinimicrobiota bacterium]
MHQTTSTPLRKLTAIMFTDIAGYTKAMSVDEKSALMMLHKQRSILKPLIKENRGTFVKEIGDGTLSYFNSSLDAATCAVKLQQSTYDDSELNIRIGVHSGQVLFERRDVFGDVVNVAARLESIAPVGGVCVSKSVFDELLDKNGFDGVSLGLQQLKGVGRLIDVFALKAEKLIQPDLKEYEENKVKPHSDEEVPSVAVLPLENKGKEEDAFYAYGITTDLISDLSKAGKIRVTSMKDIDALDLETLSSTETALKLNVRYVLSGILWKHENMFRLTIEMVDTKDNTLIWADNWQDRWEELPLIKDKIAESLLRLLNTGVIDGKKKDAIQTNTDAYEYYLKAKYKYAKRQNIEDTEIARGLFQKAIELDDTLLHAKLGLGISYHETGDYDKAMSFYEKAAKRAKVLGDDQITGASLNNIGLIYFDKGKNDEAMDYYSRSFKIRKKLNDKHGIGMSLYNIGLIYERKGDYDKSMDYHTRSLEICKELGDKQGIATSLNSIGIIYDRKGDYNKALDNFTHSHEICKELSDKRWIGGSLNSIGMIYERKGDYDKSLDNFIRSLEIKEELGDKRGITSSLMNIGSSYYDKGDYDKSLDYHNRSLVAFKELSDKRGIATSLYNIGIVYYEKRDYKKTIESLERSLTLQKGLDLGQGELVFNVTLYLFLSYKQIGKEFDPKEIYSLIKETENLECGLNLRIFELIEDKSFLETAYKQVLGKANDLEDSEKFLNYPVPKAIVEAWENLQN